MATLKQALEGILKLREEMSADADNELVVQARTKAAELFFASLTKAGFTPKDIVYDNGYFIFGYGTNSVVHYHLEECPGWRFGIWWDEPKSIATGLTGEWFAQYEETIDKFKPSASNFSTSIFVTDDNDLSWYCEQYTKFIKDQPFLAFCRDYLDWDYNCEYHTPAEAEHEFFEYQYRRGLKAGLEVEYRNRLLHVFKVHCDADVLKDFYVYDESEYVSPRYRIIQHIPNSEPDQFYWEDCMFKPHSDELDPAEIEQMKQELKAIHDWRDEMEEKYHIYIPDEVDKWLYRVPEIPQHRVEPLANF